MEKASEHILSVPGLKKAERKDLFIKLTKYAAKQIDKFAKEKGWLLGEISQETGISQTRLTELRNYKKYNKVINNVTLARLLGGKILTVKHLIQNAKLTEKEIQYVEQFVIFERPELVKEIILACRRCAENPKAKSPEEILSAYRLGKKI